MTNHSARLALLSAFRRIAGVGGSLLAFVSSVTILMDALTDSFRVWGWVGVIVGYLLIGVAAAIVAKYPVPSSLWRSSVPPRPLSPTPPSASNSNAAQSDTKAAGSGAPFRVPELLLPPDELLFLALVGIVPLLIVFVFSAVRIEKDIEGLTLVVVMMATFWGGLLFLVSSALLFLIYSLLIRKRKLPNMQHIAPEMDNFVRAIASATPRPMQLAAPIIGALFLGAVMYFDVFASALRWYYVQQVEPLTIEEYRALPDPAGCYYVFKPGKERTSLLGYISPKLALNSTLVDVRCQGTFNNRFVEVVLEGDLPRH